MYSFYFSIKQQTLENLKFCIDYLENLKYNKNIGKKVEKQRIRKPTLKNDNF